MDKIGWSKRFATVVSGDLSATAGYGKGLKAEIDSVYYGHWGNSKDTVGGLYGGITGITDVRQKTQTGLQQRTPAFFGLTAGGGVSALLAFGSGGSEGFKNYSKAYNLNLGNLSITAGMSELKSYQSFWDSDTDAYAFFGVGLAGKAYGANYEKYMVQPILEYKQDGSIMNPYITNIENLSPSKLWTVSKNYFDIRYYTDVR